MFQIIGIVLFRNEDRFLNQAISNFCDLCDQVFLFNNGSEDRSMQIAKEWDGKRDHVYAYDVNDPSYTQYCLLPYINTPTWVLAVDGDEVYDPFRLKTLLGELREGKYKESFQVMGNVLHCEDIDTSVMKASGYLARPSRSMTKLYNFSAIRSWEGPWQERLHGGKVHFNTGYDSSCKLEWQYEKSWDESLFRCLHMVFLSRSSLDGNEEAQYGRPNIAEKMSYSRRRLFINALREKMGLHKNSFSKRELYARGNLETIDISNFFDEKQKL